MSRITEITFTIKRDPDSGKITNFRVWKRVGLAGEDPAHETLYDGDNYSEAYEAMTRAVEYS